MRSGFLFIIITSVFDRVFVCVYTCVGVVFKSAHGELRIAWMHLRKAIVPRSNATKIDKKNYYSFLKWQSSLFWNDNSLQESENNATPIWSGSIFTPRNLESKTMRTRYVSDTDTRWSLEYRQAVWLRFFFTRV